MTEKMYKRYDIQDEKNDFSIETLDQMKEWLVDFWNENPDDDMNDVEHEEWLNEIMESDEDEFFAKLEGVDYSFYELDENGNEIKEEIDRLVTNLPFGYSVRSDKFEVGKKSYIQMMLYRNGKKNQSFLVDFEKWNEEHEKYVNILMQEILDK